MLHTLSTRDVGPARQMDLTFGPRLNLLTGDNGLGKSFLLDIAWWALTRTWSGPQSAQPRQVLSEVERQALHPEIKFQTVGKSGLSAPVNGRFEFADQTWIASAGRPSEPGLVIYLRVDSGCAVWDQVRGKARQAFMFSKQALWKEGLRDAQTGNVQCNGLLRDWIDWQQKAGKEFQTLCKVLDVLSPGHREHIRPGAPTRISIDDVQDIPTLLMDHGPVPIVYASAGMQRILALAYLLVWTYFEHTRAAQQAHLEPTQRLVLLIDEVDAHLHPRWQRVILPALLKAVEALQPSLTVQLLVTTHAPLVLASVEPIFQETQDQLFLLEQHGPTVTAEPIKWAKRGRVANWLTSAIFGLEQDRSLEAEEAIRAANAWMRGERDGLPTGLRSQEEIHARLEALLPGDDIFWPRWIVSQESGGNH